MFNLNQLYSATCHPNQTIRNQTSSQLTRIGALGTPLRPILIENRLDQVKYITTPHIFKSVQAHEPMGCKRAPCTRYASTRTIIFMSAKTLNQSRKHVVHPNCCAAIAKTGNGPLRCSPVLANWFGLFGMLSWLNNMVQRFL